MRGECSDVSAADVAPGLEDVVMVRGCEGEDVDGLVDVVAALLCGCGWAWGMEFARKAARKEAKKGRWLAGAGMLVSLFGFIYGGVEGGRVVEVLKVLEE